MSEKKLSYFLSAIHNNLAVINIRRKLLEATISKTNRQLAKRLVFALQQKKFWLTAMESCTGGALMNEITNIPGASNITRGGFVTYSISQKIAQGVPAVLIKKYSVYSPQVAVAMAYQARRKVKGSDFGVGITGILAYDKKERKQNPIDPHTKNIWCVGVDRIDLAVIYKNELSVKKILLAPQSSRAAAKAIIVNEVLKDILKLSA